MDPKTNPRGMPLSAIAPAAEPQAGAVRPFKSKASRAPNKAPRVWPKAAPALTAAAVRPPQPFKRKSAAPVVGAGPVSAGGNATAAVTVKVGEGPPKGSYRPTLRQAAPPPPPATAKGAVTAETPSRAARIAVRAAPGGVGPQPPNAPLWRFPPPRAEPLPPPDPEAQKRLAGVLARFAATLPTTTTEK